MRTPPTCQAAGKRCVPAFPMVRLFTRFTRGCLWPLSTLGGWMPEAPKSAERQGQGPPGPGGPNLKIAFSTLEDSQVMRTPPTCQAVGK